MPRQLPWKVGGGGTTTSKLPPRTKPIASASPAPHSSWSSSATPARSRSPAPPHARPTPRSELASTPGASSRAVWRSLGGRSPSTSPPPEPLREELMIPGVDNDDRYRMVEDEFLAVAGSFTRHLHAAEYQRLRGLAKSQNAEMIQNISRPDLVKRRNVAVEAAARQRRGVAQAVGREEKKGLRRQPTSLQGLMESPKKEPVLLTAVMGPRPGSGYWEGSPSRRRKGALEARGMGSEVKTQDRRAQEPAQPTRDLSTESDTDSDDLDAAQPSRPSKPGTHRPMQSRQPSKPLPQQPATPGFMSRTESAPTLRNPPSDLTAPPKRALTDNTATTNKRPGNPHDDEDDFFSRMRARRAEQKRRRETKTHESTIKTSASQTAALNSIPFMQ